MVIRNMVMADSAKLTFHLHSILQMAAMFGRFYKKVWPLSPRKKRLLLRKHQVITRKFGRHVVIDRKVWPTFDETKMLDAKEVIWIEEE